MTLALPTRMGTDLRAPVEYADAVEMYARKSGRHAKLVFVPPPVNCWVVQFTLKANDPTLAGFQAGKLEDEPNEPVYIWRESNALESYKAGRRHFVGYKLDELGVTGLLAFLEKTDTFSGRGQYASHTEAAKDQLDKGERAREKAESDAREGARQLAEDARRQINKIPFLPVGIDLTTPTTASGAEK